MDILEPEEINNIVSKSALAHKYEMAFDRNSAHEILSAKLEDAASGSHKEVVAKQRAAAKKEKSTFDKVLNSPTTRQVGRTVAREVTRGILDVLGVRTTSRRSSKRRTGWF